MQRHLNALYILAILKALIYIHSARIAHRDIKPSNVLISENCKIIFTNFGLALRLNDINMHLDPVHTDYVATR